LSLRGSPIRASIAGGERPRRFQRDLNNATRRQVWPSVWYAGQTILRRRVYGSRRARDAVGIRADRLGLHGPLRGESFRADLWRVCRTRGQMLRAPDAFRYGLVARLGAGGAGREPATRRHDLDAAERLVIARSLAQHLFDGFAGELLAGQFVGRQLAQYVFL